MALDIARACAIPGWMSEANLQYLAAQASTHQRVIEIGAYCGRSTRALADHAPGDVWTCDDWGGSRVEKDAVDEALLLHGRAAVRAMFLENLQDHLATGKLQLLEMTSAEAAASMLWWFGPESLDMILLDASHDLASVRNDIAAWYPLLAPGGLFVGDDVGFAGVCQAVHEAFASVELVNNWIWIGKEWRSVK